MEEFIKALFAAPIANILIVAGLVFLGIAVVGKISRRIEPGKTGWVVSGLLGLILMVTGLAMQLGLIHVLPPLPTPTTPAPTARPWSHSIGERETTMALLHIAFQEGFTGDTVVVRVNGEEVFRKGNVKTRLQIGYADSFEMNVEEGSVNVEVLLPLKNLSETIVLQVSTAVYVGVSIHEGRIDYRISDQPFGYL